MLVLAEHPLSRVTFLPDWELFTIHGFSFRNEKMRCCENILDQFKELFWARMLIDRALTVDRLFHQVNCKYEPVFLHIPEVLSIITKRKYDHWSIAEVESHHRESFYPFGLSPSARWSAVHPWPQTLWSLPIASSETSILSTRAMNLSGITFPNYYSCLRSAAVIHFFGRIFFNSSEAFGLTLKNLSRRPTIFFFVLILLLLRNSTNTATILISR